MNRHGPRSFFARERSAALTHQRGPTCRLLSYTWAEASSKGKICALEKGTESGNE